MPVKELGEEGRLVQFSEELDMVILWAVYEVRQEIINVYGSVVGRRGPYYRTSRGWVTVNPGKGDAYFAPTGRERSLSPAIRRAVKYVQEKWPDKAAQTH